MSHTPTELIEVSIEEARKVSKRGKSAEALATHAPFRKLVLEGYFVEEAARLTHLFSDPTMDESQRRMIERDLIGIGAFKRYLSTLVQMGRQADSSIRDAQEELELARQDDEDDGGTF